VTLLTVRCSELLGGTLFSFCSNLVVIVGNSLACDASEAANPQLGGSDNPDGRATTASFSPAARLDGKLKPLNEFSSVRVRVAAKMQLHVPAQADWGETRLRFN
jgi:hypothetical protein